MFAKINKLNIHYKVSGDGDPIILLHGWGRDHSCFSDFIGYFSQKFKVYAIDLPGFGLSSQPEDVWDSKEYAELIRAFVEQLGIKNPILLGHSFGGKIIINLIGYELVFAKKVILIGSSGIQLPKSLKIKLKIYRYKLYKFLINLPGVKTFFVSKIESYRKQFGSGDYKNSFGLMRKILVKTIQENVINLFHNFDLPVLLIWGDRDDQTPLQSGKIMQKNISGAELIVVKNAGHFPFVDDLETVKIAIDDFLT